ncbi:MAG: 6-carboxytetrahydropterin synthase [Patescibacteria group bacterium]|nr:6-carboxytetrahydropterin synthase [Patescibacteria group bacterium]
MFTLVKDFRFEAAHKLPHHDGKCARLHGHSWRGSIIVSGQILNVSGPKAGMLVDYGVLSATVEPLITKYLDHWYLNESLAIENPTSEMIASWLWGMVLRHLAMKGYSVKLVAVVIQETCTARCIYTGGSEVSAAELEALGQES